MHKINKHIEIVRSSIASLSSLSLKSSDAIYDLLSLHYASVGVTTINTVLDLKMLVAKQPDLVFMGMKYVPGTIPGSKVWVSAYLESHGLQHTGSGKAAIEYEQNKPLAKARVQASGVRTSSYFVVPIGSSYDYAGMNLRFPLFVKPAGLGAGTGIDKNSVAHNLEQLQVKVASIAAGHGSSALVEEFLPGREFSVAILKSHHSEKLMVMPIELLPGANERGDRILSHELKSAVLETPVQAISDLELKARVGDLAESAFIALGARDYGRIDIRLDAEGTPHFLEANLIPCLIRGSGNFPKACMINMGMGFETMILHITQLGLSRTLHSGVLSNA